MIEFLSCGSLRAVKVSYTTVTFLVVLSSALLCFAPIGVLSTGEQTQDRIQNLIDSRQYQDSLLLSIVIGIPLLIDSILDLPVPGTKSGHTERIHWAIRFAILMSLVVPNIYIYHSVLTSKLTVQIFLSTLAIVRISSRGCICIYVSQDIQKIGFGPICVSVSVCSLIEQLLWLVNYVAGNRALTYLSMGFIALTHLQVFYMLFKWQLVWKRSGRKKNCEDICISTYLSSYLVLSIGCFLISLISDDNSLLSTTPAKVSLYIYVQMFFTVIAMTVSGRVARFNSYKSDLIMEERQAFIRYISHELRTPLNAVFLGMTLVRDELTTMSPLVRNYVEHIVETVDDVNNCCEAAITILNDLLTFDKLEAGKMSVDFEETPILEYVTESLRPFRVEARQKDIKMTIRVDESESDWLNYSSLHVDRHKMGQVMRNLISNAMKFTSSGGVVDIVLSRVTREDVDIPSIQRQTTMLGNFRRNTVRPLTMRAVRRIANTDDSANCVRIQITDTGEGISLENQKKLFGQYVQFHAGKLQKGKGSGLGLWISKGIVVLHGGELQYSGPLP
jgi:signal transduction histidine kinase